MAPHGPLKTKPRRTPSEAIECAVNIQRRLASHRRSSGDAPQVRIGIHVGEVSGSASALRGASFHRAARLCAAALADSILASREALEAAHRPGSGIRELVLKGIKGPVDAGVIDWHVAH
jgi:class 3 adenylate cyclase